MKLIILITSILIACSASAQVSISAGGSMLKGFSPYKPYGGFHVSVEVPRDDAVSIYGRYTHHFKQREQDSILVMLEPRDILALPIGAEYYPLINSAPAMNYNILEGGTRYYLGNGFDYGWAAYGGSNIMLVFNKITGEHAAYDEALYEFPAVSRYEGSIFGLGFGLGGGVKYSAATLGTFYFDLNVAYMIFAQGSTDSVYPNMYDPLIFNFNLGFRKDILW